MKKKLQQLNKTPSNTSKTTEIHDFLYQVVDKSDYNLVYYYFKNYRKTFYKTAEKSSTTKVKPSTTTEQA